MKSHWRTLISFLPISLQKKYYNHFFTKQHQEWEENGKQLPVSNLLKQEVLKEFQRKYSVKTFVETGTYLGDTLFALSGEFETLFSIELSKLYHELARKRFKKMKQIHLLQGDSGDVLKGLVPQLHEQAIFWLDGHYSGGLTAKGEKECPVFEELASIFSSPVEHLIFIDDARLFVGQNDYPTLDEVKNFAVSKKPSYSFSVINDCIRLLPS